MKRTGFKPRATPLRATAPAKADLQLYRQIRCTAKHGGCGQMFRPMRKDQRACDEACAINMGPHLAKLAAEERAKAERKADREARDRLKRLGDLRTEAQAAFNAYIRARDRKAGHGCICCGEPLDWSGTKPGGAVDAGHFVSRGSAPELAFDERNVNAQRKGCNRPGGAKRDDFRAGMVARWGAEVVAELEGRSPPARLRHDDYRAIKTEYRRKARELERQQ